MLTLPSKAATIAHDGFYGLPATLLRSGIMRADRTLSNVVGGPYHFWGKRMSGQDKKHRLSVIIDDELWTLIHSVANRSYRDVPNFIRWILYSYCSMHRPRGHEGPVRTDRPECRPARHLTAKDIGKIAASLREKQAQGWIYILATEISGQRYYKIGKTRRPKERYLAMGVQSPVEIAVVDEILVEDRHIAEQAAHQRWSDRRVKGEWFDLSVEEVQEVVKFLREQHAPGGNGHA